MAFRNPKPRLYSAVVIAVCLIAGAACSRQPDGGSGGNKQGAPAAQPGQVTIRYARHLAIEYHDGYRVARVLSPWRGAKAGFTYVLVPRGQKPPRLTGGEIVIETPVRRFVTVSTVYVPFLPMLGVDDKLVGLANGQMVMTPSIARRYAEGKVAEISDRSGGMTKSLNMERLFSLRPDLIMLYGTGNPVYDFHEQLSAAGLPFAINAEYMESTPLGAAEWIKYIAIFFDKDAESVDRGCIGSRRHYDGRSQERGAESARGSQPAVAGLRDGHGYRPVLCGRSAKRRKTADVYQPACRTG